MRVACLILLAFSFSLFSEVYTARNDQDLLFVMQKLDNTQAANWALYAEESINRNQSFLETTRCFVAQDIKYQATYEQTLDFFQGIYQHVWKKYYMKNVDGDVEKAKKLRQFHIGLFDGLDNFRRSMLTKRHLEGTDVYVAYVTRDNILTYPFKVSDTKNIEMAMAVIVPNDDKTPITIHMGISRNFHNLMLGTQSPQISTQLHGFGAKVIDSIYPARTMITTPSGPMTKILVAAGLPKEDISVGMGHEGSRIEVVSSYLEPRFQFALLSKDKSRDIFRKFANDIAFLNIYRLLHINVPYVAVDLPDLSKLFMGEIKSGELLFE